MKGFVPLNRKVTLLILTTLILGTGGIGVFLAAGLVGALDTGARDSLKRQSDSVYAALESLMLPGQAELASGLFKRLQDRDHRVMTQIYRVDGTQAFVDNQTIRGVNNYIKEMKFQERPQPGTPERDAVEGYFKKAATPPAEPVFFETQESGRSEFRILKPLLNLPKCTACHGADHTIRGVLEVSSDITDLRQSQTWTLVSSGTLVLVLIFLSVWVLSRLLHRTVLKPVALIGGVCAQVTQGDFSPRVQWQSRDELGALGQRVNTMIEGLVERFKLSKYVSGTTIRSLGQEDQDQRVLRTLFFSDVRGFTAFSETRDPQEVVQHLNRLLSLQADIIKTHGGDVDKYVGDEVFAVFEGPQDVLRAAQAAVEIQKAMEAEPQLQIGIGIHRGLVIQGRIGSQDRADFTVIGDPVNTAARLCSHAGAGEILIAQDTLKQLKADLREGPQIPFKIAGPQDLQVKGKTQTLKVFKLKSGKAAP